MSKGKTAFGSKRSEKKPKIDLFKGVSYIYLVIFSLAILIPFYVVLKNSFTSQHELLGTMKFHWWPQEGLSLEHYKTALFSDELSTYGISILRSVFNTLWQGLPPAMSSLFISGVIAFCYSKLDFPGKDKFFAFTLAKAMIPGVVLMVPSYLYFNWLGWNGTVLPIMYGGLFGNSMTIFFLKQFMDGIPTDLVEAAKIDGMGYMRIYVSIMLPLCKSAFIAQFIFAVIGAWNSYMGQLMYLNGKINLYPLALALMLFQTLFQGNTGIIASCVVISLIPVLAFYVYFQKFFTEGLAMSGVKG